MKSFRDNQALGAQCLMRLLLAHWRKESKAPQSQKVQQGPHPISRDKSHHFHRQDAMSRVSNFKDVM